MVNALREALDGALRRLLPKSDMAKAIAHETKRWLALCYFLDGGRLEIGNDIAKRPLRGVAVGQRNSLFAGSKTSGELAVRNLHRHPDLQGQRRPPASLHRRRHGDDRS